MLDECTHVFVRVEADTSMPALRVRAVLDSACAKRGYPKAIRSDNGSQFAGCVMMQWAVEHGVVQVFIDPGRPQLNAHAKSVPTRFLDEFLNEHLFDSVRAALGRRVPSVL